MKENLIFIFSLAFSETRNLKIKHVGTFLVLLILGAYFVQVEKFLYYKFFKDKWKDY